MPVVFTNDHGAVPRSQRHRNFNLLTNLGNMLLTFVEGGLAHHGMISGLIIDTTYPKIGDSCDST
jgi:hypothetical protein